MQTTVLIEIFITLLIKRKMTREALAERFELSTRTITRYIDVLSKAGVPIESHSGIGGGYVLSDYYKLDRTLFTKSEYARLARALTDTQGLYPDALNRTILEKINADEIPAPPDRNTTAIEIELTAAARDPVAAWLGEKSIRKCGAGIYRASAKLPGTHNLAQKLLSFGADVKVLAPDRLREEVAEECRAILTKNDC